MTTLQVELPERLAQMLREMVQEGWFVSEQEVVRAALHEFFQRHHRLLAEQFLLEDIEWARRLAQTRDS
ncbi:MAG: ribbon-helix-helix domain-containing protein [Fimbriimonadales bacterium]|nr:ribbon-helix-helix domain-containing protein [Fimbriimonadales bacterium]